jgi:hypothetical protein
MDMLLYPSFEWPPMKPNSVMCANLCLLFQGRILLPQNLAMLLGGIMDAHDTTSIVGAAESADMLVNHRMGLRSCSQLVSTLKFASQPLAAAVNTHSVVGWRIQLACCAVPTGALLHTWATGEG